MTPREVSWLVGSSGQSSSTSAHQPAASTDAGNAGKYLSRPPLKALLSFRRGHHTRVGKHLQGSAPDDVFGALWRYRYHHRALIVALGGLSERGVQAEYFQDVTVT